MAKTKSTAKLFIVKRDKHGIHPPERVQNKTIARSGDKFDFGKYVYEKGHDDLDNMYLLLERGKLFVFCSPAPNGYMWEPCE